MFPSPPNSCKYIISCTSKLNDALTSKIDTGSTDTVLPHNNLNGYTGPTINYTIPVGKEKTISSTYGDGSFWWGYPVSMDVGLGGTNLNSSAPLSLMTSQSTAPIFASGKSYQGLMGVAFPALSNSVSAPYSVMDAWVANSVVSTNQIAFHGCPYTLETSSWIDFGNETPYKGCNNDQKAAVMMPSKTYYNINLAGIAVNGTAQVMPSAFQTGTTWSFMDSCTSNIMVPSVTLLTLQTLITNSGAISNLWMSSGYIGSWLNSNIMIPFGPNDLKWELLPNISFTINTQASATLSTVTLTLGPRQYIQANPSGYYTFMIGTWGDQYAVLGLPFFSAYHIVVDRDSGQISFQLGCNCENSPDGYPKISTFGQTILTASSNCTAADTTPVPALFNLGCLCSDRHSSTNCYSGPYWRL